MNIYSNNKYRIRRNGDQEKDMKRLIEAKIFDQYKDILMISAVLAFNQNISEEISNPANDAVQIINLQPRDLDYIDYIAFAKTNDKEILKSDDKYKIFSEYANAGFPILLRSLEIPEGDITEEIAKKAIIKYYRLLLSNSFINLAEVQSAELDDELFK